MPMFARLLCYLRDLSTGRLILWCYFIWYAVSLALYFDADPRIWLNAVGISGIIGTATYVIAG